jgi:hypothetical protein
MHRVSTAMFDIVEDVAPVIATQMIKRVPSLGPLENREAFEATRRSALGSMYELLCTTRAGLLEPGVIETSPEALEHLRFLKMHGVGMKSLLGFYHIGFAMFEPLMGFQLSRFTRDNSVIQQMAGPMRGFIYMYVDQITRRLAAEYPAEREGWVSDPNDPVWHDPDSVQMITNYLQQMPPSNQPEGASARRYCQAALERFCDSMETAARNRQLSPVLARANTTVRIQLADEPELACTLLLDRDPIEVADGNVPADVRMSIMSIDLSRLYSPDFHLPMAIFRGRVGYDGPVRKFLRVSPVVRHASIGAATNLPESDGHHV